MSTRTWQLPDDVHRWLVRTTVHEHPELVALRERTAGLPMSRMQISPEQGRFMQFLVGLIGARRVLEIGTFTGYSALAMALALPRDGRILACDVSDEWTSIGREHWEAAGVADRIELRLAPALETLDALLAQGVRSRYDLAFIDADKENSGAYYERCLELVRPGGLIAVDNVLWSGRVADESDQSADTVALRALNQTVAADPRVDASLVPIGDGLLLARVR